ncbi:CIS tube protein [Parafilimonas sp.]|uniref:CIS tube protein n=1 Tax=Parafilimonas sp. TaxID=1969739 RepID=UPI0039E5A8DC
MGATPDKLKVTAYTGTGSSQKLSTVPDDTYMALVNPETYAIQYQIVLNSKKIPGTSGSDPNYVYTPVPSLHFDFLFDATGVIPRPNNLGVIGDIPVVGAIASAVSNIISPSEEYDVMNEIEKFKKVLFTYKGVQHSPNKVQILWGKLIFDGKLTSLNFNFKLFKPDGTPLRAVASANFSGAITDKLRVAEQADNSPDLTHIRQVTEGDTLPLMTYKIYGDASYYLEVARVNNITNFRSLKVGDKIKFPPINK